MSGRELLSPRLALVGEVARLTAADVRVAVVHVFVAAVAAAVAHVAAASFGGWFVNGLVLFSRPCAVALGLVVLAVLGRGFLLALFVFSLRLSFLWRFWCSLSSLSCLSWRSASWYRPIQVRLNQLVVLRCQGAYRT